MDPPHQDASERKRNFLVTYGNRASTITCVACRKTTRMFGAPGQEVTAEEVGTYRRAHVCGPEDDGWDIAPVSALDGERGESGG